jgi:predicted acetyltransferase
MKFERETSENRITVRACDGDGRAVARGGAVIRGSRLDGAVVRTMTVGGLSTEPEYRRAGTMRRILAEMNAYAGEQDAPVSMLHPFSFAYYRKFGYERVADHRILEFPMSALDFLPRESGLVRCRDASQAADLDAVYNEFSQGRNIMFPRHGFSYPTDGPEQIYLWYDGGRPAGYAAVQSEKVYCINRMASVNLHVRELCFTSPDSLRRLLGFLRMFEG